MKTYTRYYGVDDEEQKKILSVGNCTFFKILWKGAIYFLIFLKGSFKKVLDTLI